MWTRTLTLALIEDIRCNPCLWNSSCDEFKKRDKRFAAYKALGEKYGVSGKEIELKYIALKNQFRREQRRLEKYEEGLSPKQIHWFGYEPLMFLLNNCVKRASTSLQMKSDPNEQTQDYIENENSEPEYTEYVEYETVTETPKMTQPISFTTTKSSQGAATATEAFKCMRTLAEKICSRDEFDVYGEYIAHKLRDCGRSLREIAIAQHEINTICFKLSMGELGQNMEGSLQGSVHSNPEIEQELVNDGTEIYEKDMRV